MAEGKQKGPARGKEDIKIDLGLGGIFKGVESLLETVARLAQTGATEFREEREEVRGEKGKEVKAVYGVSVKVGLGGEPKVETFGNVREEEGKAPVIEDVREPMVDVFDEEDHVLLVAEMPGVNEQDIRYDVEGDVVSLSAETEDRKYHKELLLPAAVTAARAESQLNNGVLELKLWKAQG